MLAKIIATYSKLTTIDISEQRGDLRADEEQKGDYHINGENAIDFKVLDKSNKVQIIDKISQQVIVEYISN